jgi:hypothetical protein
VTVKEYCVRRKDTGRVINVFFTDRKRAKCLLAALYSHDLYCLSDSKGKDIRMEVGK